MSATLLLQIVERAHRYMDAHGYPERACPPSFATAELMKEPTVSVVSDLFDNPRRLTDDGEPYSRAHGTHGGVSRHHRDGETLCDECATFLANYRRHHGRQPTTTTTDVGRPAQEAAKLLFFHRMERAKLRATLTPEERARLAAS